MKKFLLKHHWLAFVLLSVAALAGGCATQPERKPTVTAPVCDVLGNPIPFSQNQKAHPDWYAGPKLAVRVHQHNDTGVNLRCPRYKK